MKIGDLPSAFAAAVDLLRRRAVRRNELISGRDRWSDAADEMLEAIGREPVGFVLSTGRCGTAQLARLLRMCPQVDAHHVADPPLRVMSGMVWNGHVEASSLRAVAIASRADVVVEAIVRKRLYVETNPYLTPLSRGLVSAFPQAKFIHLVREPFDFARSWLARGAYSGHLEDLARPQPHADSPEIDLWRHYDDFHKALWAWRRINLDIEEFASTVDTHSFLRVRSEDLFGSPEAFQRIASFLSVDSPRRSRMEKELRYPTNASPFSSDGQALSDNGESVTLRRLVTEHAEQYGYEYKGPFP